MIKTYTTAKRLIDKLKNRPRRRTEGADVPVNTFKKKPGIRLKIPAPTALINNVIIIDFPRIMPLSALTAAIPLVLGSITSGTAEGRKRNIFPAMGE